MSFFEYLISLIGSFYPTIKNINGIIGTVITFLFAYKTIYVIVGIFATRKFKPARKNHKYAILIAARNEEEVIDKLLDSIKKQDYPSNLITTFVVADNCTDKTAEIVRKHGAICYERFDENHKTKGFALQFLLEQIEKDYGRMSFEGYFIFDADNLLKQDYITKMNNAFDAGEKIITSYRHTKNFDENWIASTYAIHWLRSIRTGHRARSIFHLATNIQGTGFLFASEIVKDGWKYTGLTEDRALTVDSVAAGYQITYQDEAIFYDEQPTNLNIVLRQRLRWSKGHLLAFLETGPKLFKNIFLGHKNSKNKSKPKDFKQFLLNILESIRHRFASFDILMLTIPFSVINLFRWLVVSVFFYSCYSYTNGINNVNFFGGSTYLAKFIRSIVNVRINVEPGINALLNALLIAFWARIFYRIGAYFEKIIEAVYIFIIERKRIKKIPLYKKVFYCFTWPIFEIIGRYTTYIALFKKVEWKPIPHNSKITIDDLNKETKK